MKLPIFSRKDTDDAGPLSVSGNARVDGGAAFPSGLNAKGDLVLGTGANVEGSLRVHGDLVLEKDARVEGDVTVEGDAYVAEGACIDGHLECRRLQLGARPESREREDDEEAPVAHTQIA